MAINKLNRQNWNNITIHKIKLEDAQNRIDSNRRFTGPFYTDRKVTGLLIPDID